MLVSHACGVVHIGVQQGAILVKGHGKVLMFQGFSSRLNIQKNVNSLLIMGGNLVHDGKKRFHML